jgi:DNA-binding MarR family transcriptional regulator
VSKSIGADTGRAWAELFPEVRLAPTGTLLEAQHAVAAVIERLAVGPAGLDAPTAELLMRLAQSADCGIRGVDIGVQCQMTATRVSRLVDRAEADGLVRRTPDPLDRRAQHVVMTEKGHEAAERLAPLMAGVLDELVFETLSARERETLIELLGRLRDRAQEMLAEN